jgi:hypothetical protein
MKQLFITLFLAALSIAGFTQENCNPYFYYYSYDFEDGTNFSPYIYNSTLNYFWDFGDGTTSTDIFPFVEYAASGTYSVCLTVNNSELTCEEIVLLLNPSNASQIVGRCFFETPGNRT